MMKRTYNVKIRIEKLTGGIPAHPDVVRAWLAAHDIQDNEELAERISSGIITEAQLEEELLAITTTFREADGNPCLEARCVKAAIKQAAGVMGLYGIIPGLKELLKEGSEVVPELIVLHPVKDESCTQGMKDEVQTQTQVVHAITPQGKPVTSFKRTRYVNDAILRFQVKTTDRFAIAEKYGVAKKMQPTVHPGTEKKGKPLPRKTAFLSLEMLKDILEYAGEFTGFGANRAQGSGKAVLVSIEETKE